eukprot:NODE_4153_length_834_cov_28.394625_g3995_i0.p1 GENE.NODE_4153_length_834_cov_28.394625_g3995_i0~~NODE_4153_length_834_cov_28.394625_g3995_i0.p1  ORF type:complete len:254 (+),score=43.01 NODE_4153_length_834_cov_28.394625_g3995_i0:61-762(+)
MGQKSSQILSADRSKLNPNNATNVTNFPVQITPNIFIGGHPCLRRSVLESLGIKYVLNCALELHHGPWVRWATLKQAGIQVRHLDWDDLPSQRILPSKHTAEALKWMQSIIDKGGKVLVNCAAGRSRSTSMVMAHLIANQGLSFEHALNVVTHAHSLAEPNPAFCRQLKRLAKQHALPPSPFPSPYPPTIHNYPSAGGTASFHPLTSCYGFETPRMPLPATGPQPCSISYVKD